MKAIVIVWCSVPPSGDLLMFQNSQLPLAAHPGPTDGAQSLRVSLCRRRACRSGKGSSACSPEAKGWAVISTGWMFLRCSQ